MKFEKTLTLSLAVAGILCLAGCNKDYVGKENSHPLFSKAVSYKTSQNYLKSAESFEGFLVQCPKSAKAHRELAELYDSYLNEYIKAIYHYEKYMDYAALSNAERQDVRRIVDGLKQKFYEKYQRESGQVPMSKDEKETLQTQLSAQKQFNGKLLEKYKELLENYRKLSAQNTQMRDQIKAYSSPTSPRRKAADAKAPASKKVKAQQTAAAANGSAVIHEIRPGETLSIIARRYKVSSKAIHAANRAVIGPNPSRIRVGMKLRSPARSAAAPAAKKATTRPAAAAKATGTTTTATNAKTADDILGGSDSEE